MLLLISPTKTLDFSPIQATLQKLVTQPRFTNKVDSVANAMKALSKSDMKKTLKVSDALTSLNYERFQQFKLTDDIDKTTENKPAGFAYQGDAFNKFQADSLSVPSLSHIQDQLRIISAVYGVLRPLDAIQPYRLCMGDKLSVENTKNMYEFWKEDVTNMLKEDIKTNKVKSIINVASDEYYKAVDIKKLCEETDVNVYKMKFDTAGKVASAWGKQGRGLIARYVALNQISTPEQIKSFDLENYKFDETRSSEFEFYFSRPAAPPPVKKAKKATVSKRKVEEKKDDEKKESTKKAKTKKS